MGRRKAKIPRAGGNSARPSTTDGNHHTWHAESIKPYQFKGLGYTRTRSDSSSTHGQMAYSEAAILSTTHGVKTEHIDKSAAYPLFVNSK